MANAESRKYANLREAMQLISCSCLRSRLDKSGYRRTSAEQTFNWSGEVGYYQTNNFILIYISDNSAVHKRTSGLV
jgi:hypothetical protein